MTPRLKVGCFKDYLGSSAILVVISHRLSTVRGSDGIVVLRDGGAVGIGRHEELLDEVCGLWGVHGETAHQKGVALRSPPVASRRNSIIPNARFINP